MPKIITNDVKKVVLKVKEFFIKEKERSNPVIAFEKVNERVAAATGISIRTVTRISREGIPEASSSKLVTPGQKRKINKDKLLLDNSDSGILQRKKKKKVVEVNIGKPSSQKQEIVYIKQEMVGPKQEMVYLKQEMVCQKQGMVYPQQEMVCPKQEMVCPKQEKSFEAVTTDDCGNYCTHVIKIENMDSHT